MDEIILKTQLDKALKLPIIMSVILAGFLSVSSGFKVPVLPLVLFSLFPVVFIGLAVFILCSSTTLSKSFLVKKSFTGFGYKGRIPWENIHEIKIVDRKGFTKLKLLISYKRNYFSRNNSKEMDREYVYIDVSFTGKSDKEILQLVRKYKACS
ncbi:hypothetical protein [Thalassotalea fusca]